MYLLCQYRSIIREKRPILHMLYTKNKLLDIIMLNEYSIYSDTLEHLIGRMLNCDMSIY